MDIGYDIGARLCEYISYKEKITKRGNNIINVLHFISNTVWKNLFNSVASVEKHRTDGRICMYSYYFFYFFIINK